MERKKYFFSSSGILNTREKHIKAKKRLRGHLIHVLKLHFYSVISIYPFYFQRTETTTLIQRQCDMIKVFPPVDVVLTAAVVIGAAVVDSLACPTHVPTFPTLSTAASSTFCEQQELL